MEALFENSSKRERRFELRIVTLTPGVTASLGAVQVTPFPMVHGDSSGPFLGYRIEVEGRIIAFTGDTEWTDALIPLGRDADLFISECYFYDRAVKNHLNLKTLQAHLAEIRPKRLILTHMGEDMLARLDSVACEAASDGMVVEI
jgi:ribonuclease BN (tRNA processing enzyme)